MKKRALSLTLAVLMALSLLNVLLIAPVMAAESTTPEINWLSIDASDFTRISYIEELDWFCFFDGTNPCVVERTTGTKVEYDEATPFFDGLARVMKQDAEGHEKYGYIDTTGAVVAPLEYDGAGNFVEGLAIVIKNGADGHRKFGYIDATGAVVIPLEYNYAEDFSEGLALVEENGKNGYIDKTGAVVIPLENDVGGAFSEGLAMVYNGSQCGYIDKSGAVVVPFEYDRCFPFSEGLALVWKEDDVGNVIESYYIDTKGEIVISLAEYDSVSRYVADFYTGLTVVVRTNQKYGFIDKTGAVVVPLEYDAAGIISEPAQTSARYCWVAKGASFGYFENPNWTPNGTSDTKQGNGILSNWTPSSTSSTKQGNGDFPVAIVAGVAAAVVVVAVVLVVLLKKKKPAPIPVGATAPGPIPERARKVSAPPSEPSPVSRPSPGPEPAGGPKFCSNCGKPLKPGMKFCPDCGQPLQS